MSLPFKNQRSYYPTLPFWPLTCYLKSVNDTESDTKNWNYDNASHKMWWRTIKAIKVADTHAAAQSMGWWVTCLNKTSRLQLDWMQRLGHCEHSNNSLVMTASMFIRPKPYSKCRKERIERLTQFWFNIPSFSSYQVWSFHPYFSPLWEEQAWTTGRRFVINLLYSEGNALNVEDIWQCINSD